MSRLFILLCINDHIVFFTYVCIICCVIIQCDIRLYVLYYLWVMGNGMLCHLIGVICQKQYLYCPFVVLLTVFITSTYLRVLKYGNMKLLFKNVFCLWYIFRIYDIHFFIYWHIKYVLYDTYIIVIVRYVVNLGTQVL